ncbi:MAG TPA: heparinase II/III family protein [Polyangiaceae bacterium]|nr:heparinase II/III family protein [Polyangiaceae bacterium]
MIAKRERSLVAWSLLALSALGVAACGRLRTERAGAEEARTQRAAPVVLGQATLAKPQSGASRILLDAPALQRLRDSAQLRTPAFVRAQARAEQGLRETAQSGYQGFEWADMVATQALLWHATSDVRYADGAVRYLQALLDDRLVVGDGKGGAEAVRHDSGYGIRTFGAYAALGHDWLRHAPAMNDALRARVRERLGQWLDWYQQSGYLRDRPTANYYWGYLTALSFAGLAAAGESKTADVWLKTAQDELSNRVLPEFRDKLKGGGWPEGWQYGEYTTLEIALVSRALQTGAGIDVRSKLPWLGETVTHKAHALLPDGKSVYDGGTWGEHPARASALGVAALSIALEGFDEARAAEARWLMERALPPLQREQVWLGLLADRPRASMRSPRAAGVTSLHVPGQGLTFVRSDWSEAATWASFQAGPRLAEDHQDADQGHFELFRGSDGLLIDGGGSEGSATINHNTLLIDDAGKNLNYPPNQGVWGARVKTTRFGDDGQVVVAVGEIGEAYAPKCASQGCSRRSVEELTRSFVFVRPALLVIDDRLKLEDPDYDAIWAAHLSVSPRSSGDLSSALVGSSRVDVRTLEPAGAVRRAPREPTPSGEGSHRLNQPWGPMWRLEVVSARGERQRRFLHFISAGPASAEPPVARRLVGKGLSGGVARLAQGTIAVLFADGAGDGQLALGGAVDGVVVADLVPGQRYQLTLDSGSCSVRLSKARSADAPAAGPGGFLRAGGLTCGAR